jgi:hypothetical protein
MLWWWRTTIFLAVLNTFLIATLFVIGGYREYRDSGPIVTNVNAYLEKSIIHNGEGLVTIRSMTIHQQCLIRVTQFVTPDGDPDDVLWQSPAFESIYSGTLPGEQKNIKQHVRIPDFPTGSYAFQVRSEFICKPSGRWFVLRGPMLLFTIAE